MMNYEQLRTEIVVAYMGILHGHSFEETSVSMVGRPDEILNRYFLIYFWDLKQCILLTDVSEEHIASVFRVK
jgi:hypothetical protein